MSEETREEQGYETPVVRDYGDLVKMTAAMGVDGFEDGAGKQTPHHTAPLSP